MPEAVLEVQAPVWTFDKFNEWNKRIRKQDEFPDARIEVANEMLVDLGQNPTIESDEEANAFMKSVVQAWLDDEKYMQAAVFLLGRDYFDERSVLVKDIFTSLQKYDRNSIPGASSVSKSFSVVIWHAMDWLRDPENTAIRVTALSDTTLRNNIFNNLTHCFRSMILDYGVIYGNLFIGLNIKDRQGCISGITYPQDSNETGRFKGFKPISRNGPPHKQFGSKTRVRLIMEEASNMPDGVRQELNSMESSLSDTDDGRVKLTAIFNPYHISHWTAKISAPKEGIASLDIEKDHQWESADGWHVTRLDAKRCENVVNKKVLISCMMSHKKFKELESRGASSVDYCCYGRGFWPVAGSYYLLIPRYLLDGRKCQPLFMGSVLNVATCDTAIVEDSIVLSPARWGRAVGIEWPDGRKEMFDPANPHPQRKKPKHILWCEPQIKIQLQRRDTMLVAEAIRDMCKAVHVEPEWLAVDSTGSGIGIYDWLYNNFGSVFPIQWASKATEYPILENSTQKPVDLYDRISSEMWFAFRDWLEYDLIFLSPNFVDEPLFSQLTGRRLPLREKSQRGKLSVESKSEYKSHEGGVSPDEADSAVMLPQLIRMRGQHVPGMAENQEVRRREPIKSVHTRDTINGMIQGEQPEAPIQELTFDERMQRMAGQY